MADFKIYNDDCMNIVSKIPDKSIDLVVIDPPYQIDNTKAGGHSELAKSIQGMNDEISENDLTKGFDTAILDELWKVMKKPNIYIWCNAKQIPIYLNYFVNEKNCKFDIIIWNKTNATPLFNNKYLTDKEYCLYFRKHAYCNPANYEDAKTVYQLPINIKDKRLYGHPTIKPLPIITNLIKNSSHENDTVLDCFMGSGTTGVACMNLNRKFIGVELNKKYYDIADERIRSVVNG